MKEKKKCERPGEKKSRDEKKPAFGNPVLTKYGTVKDVYRGPSCKAVMATAADK